MILDLDWTDYPDLSQFLEWLNDIERRLDIPWDKQAMNSGKRIVEKIFDRDGGSGMPVNVIPPVGRLGGCERILFVAIGGRDNVKRRILEAIEHIAAKCPNRTKYVVFYCAKWDHVTWLEHMDSFRRFGVVVVKKEFLLRPIRLL